MVKIAVIFPGQGSQYVGMGEDFFKVFPESKRVFQKADQALGIPISKFCFEGPVEKLNNTSVCQPAILTVSIAAFEAFKSLIKEDYKIAYSAGLSLGEYSALASAGVFKFEDAIKLVKQRSEFMEEAAKKNPGKMAAVLGLDFEKVEGICRESGAQIANLNCPGQVVVTGSPSSIESVVKLSQENKARAIVLQVSGAFHSTFMKEAAERFKTVLAKTDISQGNFDVISNVTAQPQKGPEAIRENLVKQIYSSVRWEDSIRFMIKEGISTYFEIGPGKVLSGLLKKIDPALAVYNIQKVSDLELA